MNFWKNKNVFITGIDGFVGSHLAKELIQQNANVIGLTRNKQAEHHSYLSILKIFDRVQLIYGSVTDYHLMRDILSSYDVQYVFHQAAQSIVQTSSTSPYDTLDNNIRGTYSLLDACHLLKNIEGVVVASSDKAYGTHDELPYTEKSPLNARNIYECSKACTDNLTLAYAWNFELPAAVTRCCNIVGFDLNFTRLIPRTVKHLMFGESPVIYSGVLDFTREFIHVDDAVNAYLAVAENIGKTKGQAFNVASGNILSIREVVERLCKMMRVKNGYRIIDKNIQSFKEIPHQYLSGELLKQTIGWQSRLDTEKMFAKTIEHYTTYRSIIFPGG